jgi:hypothetical protein
MIETVRLKSMISARKLLAFFCLVAVVVAALTPVSAALFWAVVVPLLFVVGSAAIVWAKRQPQESAIPTLSCLPVIASRAPPIADLLI